MFISCTYIVVFKLQCCLFSFISAVTVLGLPAETYIYGFMYTWIILAFIPAILISMLVYIPVFYKLQLTSVNEVRVFLSRIETARGLRFSQTVIFSRYCSIIYLATATFKKDCYICGQYIFSSATLIIIPRSNGDLQHGRVLLKCRILQNSDNS